MDTPATGTGPAVALLEGLRVLDLTRLHPGAHCTALLADLGADVLKVEAPGVGDGLRDLGEQFPAAHTALNRGKRSVTLDVRSPGGADVLRRLASDVDVVVEGERPGSLDARGIGYEDLRRTNPRLIWCSITGYGPDGPNAQAPGRDLAWAGHSGLLSQLTIDGTPPKPTAPLTLQVAALAAALGIASAVVHRERTGSGARIDTSMVDAGTWMLAEQLTRVANSEPQAPGVKATRNVYRCSDDRWVTCTTTGPRAWARLVEALELPDLADAQARDGEESIVRRFMQAFAAKPQAHWIDRPGPSGGVGAVRELEDLVDDPQITEHHGMPRVDGDGPQVVASPLRIDGRPSDLSSQALTSPPALGEHTAEVLRSVGYTEEEIAALRADEVI